MAEVTTTVDGQILHRKDCSRCDGSGELEYAECQHYGLCDCSSSSGACEDCGGDGEVLDDECDCDECCAAFARFEGRAA